MFECELKQEWQSSSVIASFNDDSSLAIVSTFRTERTEKENLQLLNKFKQLVRAKNLGFTELKSRWAEMNPDGSQNVSDERSLIVYGLSLDTALEFGKMFQQASIIFKDKDKCAEVCTTPFVDWKGVSHTVGSIVQTLNLKSTSTPFNINDARDIFEKRKGGPVSILIKSNRPFTLKELFEVEPPRGSTFSRTEKLIKIL